MSHPLFWLLVFLSSAPAALRLVDHPWNLAPASAMALFAGVQFRQKRWAFLVPLLAIFASDVGLGLIHRDLKMWTFYPFAPLIYLCYAAFIGLGCGVGWSWKRLDGGNAPITILHQKERTIDSRKIVPLALGSFTGAVLFFVVTNFADWYFFETYEKNFGGLMECYAKGIPFFRNSLISDAICVPTLFLLYEMGRALLEPAGSGEAASEI